MVKHTRRKGARKPGKPHPDFPLFRHATGRWCKKVKGKFCYFGKVADDPEGEAALELWLDQKDDLLAGRTPRAKPQGLLTVHDLCNCFMLFKKNKLETGELSIRSYSDYLRIGQFLVDTFGNRPVTDLGIDDFAKLRTAMAARLGTVALSNEITRIRVLFKYGYDAGLIDRPIRYGPDFKRPSKKSLRAARNAKAPRMFEPAELRSIIEAADQPIRAMILLGVNCGFGNADVGTMPMSAVDLDGGWVQFPRPKTGTARRCPLWSETVTAIRESLAGRPEPKSADDAGLLFVTKYGQSWAKDTTDNPVSKEFAKLLKRPRCPKCGKIEAAAAEECSGCKWKPAKGNPWQTLYRTGRNFYALRHCFETIGGESRDQVAVDHIMGHIRDDMASVYREGISDDRLRAVVNCVRAWLWPKMDAPAPAAGNTGQEQ